VIRQRLSVAEYTQGILAGDRTMLGRAITVIESKLAEDKVMATEILQSVLLMTGKALRIGITGVPGVGKSTFIETLGQYLISLGQRVAVLAIDPSSKKSGGSILGDKTRMENLAHNPHAFIRPSATGLSLGGVARSTRETMLLCEAAGYDIILIETVGVGQSETLVKGMTDFFLLLMLAGAGDELQGIKRGIMEMVDAIAINKADGTNQQPAALAVNEYQNALHHLPEPASGFTPKVVACSAMEGSGIDAIWKIIQEYNALTRQNGFFAKNRQFQNVDWLHEHIRESLEDQFYRNAMVREKLSGSEEDVREGKVLPMTAAQELINLFLGRA
jgi:LAO/AO transport system kinase